MAATEMNILKSLEDFSNKIRRWEHNGCDRKLCEDFVLNLGYVNFVWLWDIGLTARIRKFCLNSSARKYLHVSIHLLGVDMGRYSGVWNTYSVNDDGNRAMSMMSLWCRYCWLSTYFTASSWVSFDGFELVIADFLGMSLLHLIFLTGVNNLFNSI